MSFVRQFCVFAALAVIATGCVSSRQIIPMPDRTTDVPPNNKARIYVMRHTGYFKSGDKGAAISDGRVKIGGLGPAGFLCWDRPPGDTLINTRVRFLRYTTPLHCEAGKVYYLKLLDTNWGPRASFALEMLSPEEGIKLLAKSKPPKIQR